MTLYKVCSVTLSLHPPPASEKVCVTTAGMESTTFDMLA